MAHFDKNNKKLKPNLKKIRMEKFGMERKDFADMLLVIRNTYYGYERGTSIPSLPEAYRICKIIKLPIEEVWSEECDTD